MTPTRRDRLHLLVTSLRISNQVLDNELQKSKDLWYKNHVSLIKLDMKKMCDKLKKELEETKRD